MIPAWTVAMMAASWAPSDLGSKLRAWWAPPGAGNITLNGSGIASWTDQVGGYVLSQATAASQPLYDASSFGGLACARFDGADDYLALAGVPSGIPTGAATSEYWIACRQDAAPADTTGRSAFSIGAGSSSGRRQVVRVVNGGENNARASSSGAASDNGEDFSGVCVIRAVFGATTRCDQNGVTGPDSGAMTHATDTTRITMGVNAAFTGGTWNGAIREVLVTELLTDDEAAKMYAWLNGSF